MKTFEEAFSCTFKTAQSEAEIKTGSEEMKDLAFRYREIQEEVLNSERFQDYVRTILEIVANDEGSATSAIFSVFMSGLIAGMEMEKP